ncbi:MAG: GGDEF domain-containing protein [bacterium]|nr:GGDEF domain-containing protein [bacterium]
MDKNNFDIIKFGSQLNEVKLIQYVFNSIASIIKYKLNCVLYLHNKTTNIKKVYCLNDTSEKGIIRLKYSEKIEFHNRIVDYKIINFKLELKNQYFKMIFYILGDKKQILNPYKKTILQLIDYLFLQLNSMFRYHEYLENIKTREKGIIGLNEFADLLNYLETSEETAFQSMFLGFAAESIEANRVTFYFYEKERNILYPNAIMVYKNKKVVPYDYYSELKDITIKAGEDVCGNTIINKEPVFMDKVNQDIYKGYVDKKINLNINSIIDIPIIIRDNIIGVLELANSTENKPFSKFDFYIVSIIAKLAMTKLEQGELYNWAMIDNLTQLYNYHYLQIYLNNEMARTKRYAKELGLILIDIDNFKKINDNYGHSAGNIVLRNISKIIKQNIRVNVDIPVRYGGDEFLIILPETDTEGTNMLASRVLDIIRAYDFQLEGSTIKVTCSMGISNINSESFSENKDEIIKKADVALYKAKNSGKNRIVSAI